MPRDANGVGTLGRPKDYFDVRCSDARVTDYRWHVQSSRLPT